MTVRAKESSPLEVAEIKKIYDAINARTGDGVDGGLGVFTLVQYVENHHGRKHMPSEMHTHVFERYANGSGTLSDIDTVVAFVRDIESMHGIGPVVDAREVARQRDALLNMLNWVSDECKVYPESSDEKAFALRLLTAIHHPKSGMGAVANKASPVEAPPAKRVSMSIETYDPARVLLHALDVAESLAMGNDPKDLPQIAQISRIALREYREQKAAADAQKAAQAQAETKAVAKLSERLADAYVLIQDAIACIRATTHWGDLDALQRKLSDAVKAYRSTPEQGAHAPSAPMPRGRPRM